MKEGFFQNLLFCVSIYIVSVTCQGPFLRANISFLIAKVYIKFKKLDKEMPIMQFCNFKLISLLMIEGNFSAYLSFDTDFIIFVSERSCLII